MKTLFQTALELQGFLAGKGWRFCFIGGLAIQRWGEPRLTVDVDVSLLTGFGGEEEFIRSLMAAYPPRIPDAARFALENRVLLLQSADGVGLDIALAGLPFEEAVVRRSSAFEFLPGISLVTCSAEDLSWIFQTCANIQLKDPVISAWVCRRRRPGPARAGPRGSRGRSVRGSS